jgi:16S rRNA (guanine527-N7)-methyltransferase
MSHDPMGLWKDFSLRHHLTISQLTMFQEYYVRLVSANERYNLTAITDLEHVITDHFDDSLALIKKIDCSKLKGLADIGTGAGFPGIPLKIIYPSMPLYLIEVSEKKRSFLQELIDAFLFEQVHLSELDWRTFLRKTFYDIDLFCARASLQPEELIRVFKPASPYRHATLVYWAAQGWEPSQAVQQYLTTTMSYQVGAKQRYLVFLNNPRSNDP